MTADNVASINQLREKRPALSSNQVRVLLLLDRSASMKGHEEGVMTELRSFLGGLRSAFPGAHCLLTLVQFAATAQLCALLQPLEKVPIEYQAIDEGTALWDAIAFLLNLEKSRYEPPIFCVFATDGEENCSEEASFQQVQAMKSCREEWGNWSFIWLNWQGKPSRAERALRVECIDSPIAKMGEGFSEVTRRMTREFHRLRATRRLLLKGGR